jgi:hypothetical protein
MAQIRSMEKALSSAIVQPSLTCWIKYSTTVALTSIVIIVVIIITILLITITTIIIIIITILTCCLTLVGYLKWAHDPMHLHLVTKDGRSWVNSLGL